MLLLSVPRKAAPEATLTEAAVPPIVSVPLCTEILPALTVNGFDKTTFPSTVSDVSAYVGTSLIVTFVDIVAVSFVAVDPGNPVVVEYQLLMFVHTVVP
jgi:hypothetical protein